MPIISIRIPQLGEGLQEALLVEFLAKPGDIIKRDQPIYVMETDKATTDVESPYEGKLVSWTVETGSVLSIGTEIAKMEVAEGVREMPAGHGPADHSPSAPAAAVSATSTSSAPVRRADVQIPPKTRKLLKDHGLLDLADQIPCSGSKLMPEDVERYLAAQAGDTPAAAASATPVTNDQFSDAPLPMSQISLNYRLTRGAQLCVPVTVINDFDWTAIEAARQKTRATGGPTGFAMACWAVVRALERHPKFRSTLSTDAKRLRTFHRVNLGIAVALPGDEMVTAVVRAADTMSQSEFFAAMAKQIEIARGGRDQADESTTVSVSNMGKAGMRIGIPAIVAPAVATLALGATFWQPFPQDHSCRFCEMVTATLSFDHRVVNGVGAANFLNDVKLEVETFKLA
jgi:pyruvate dehydrogenase E2 component (dihydrolipoamide acetyltransferase)